MATIITEATLTTTITETIILNDKEYGNEITQTFATQGKVDQRIMEIIQKGEEGVVWTTILATSTADGKGTIIANDWAYFRITNLDDTHAFNLELFDGGSYLYFKIEAGESFLLMSPDVDCLGEIGAPTFTDVQTINGQSDSVDTNIEIEYLIVSA